MIRTFSTGAVVAALTATTLVFGQGTATGPKYDPKAEVTVRGRVTEVRTSPGWMGQDGVHVTVETRYPEVVRVDIAPAEFLKSVDFTIAVGDDLEVTGSYARSDGSSVLLARHLKKHRVTISVRDPSGAPVW